MKIQNIQDLKPAEGEISQIQTLTGSGKIMHWSIYKKDKLFMLVKGYIFHERQNHEVFGMNGSYERLVTFMNKQSQLM